MYKDDGERGHHMGDYIPKEELAKFMAKCGNTELQQQVGGGVEDSMSSRPLQLCRTLTVHYAVTIMVLCAKLPDGTGTLAVTKSMNWCR